MIPTIRLRFSPTTPKLRARVYPGIPPLQAEFRNNGTSIQWRVGASGAWTDIATLASITGPVAAIVAGTGIAVDSTDITHPIVSLGSKPDARDYLDVASYVATRPALKALVTSKETVAYLKEAGREGIFVFKAGDYAARVTADTAEGVYIKADDTASSAGAWVRIYSGSVQPEWYGAVGDGSTDDTAAVQAAFSSGESVYLPKFYKLTNTINVPATGERQYRGRGKTVLTFTANMNKPYLKLDTTPNSVYWVEFSDMLFDSTNSGTRTAEAGISISGSVATNWAMVKCRNIGFTGLYHCILVDKAGNAGGEGQVAKGEYVGLWSDSGSNGLVPAYGIRATTSINNGIVISDCILAFSQAGIAIGNGSIHTGDIVISAVQFFGDATAGNSCIRVNGGSVYAYNISVVNCQMEGATYSLDYTNVNGSVVRGCNWGGGTTLNLVTCKAIQIDYSEPITPAQIVANTNDYNPSDATTGIKWAYAGVLRVSTDASRNLTGLKAFGDSRNVLLINAGSFNLVLSDASASSTAANRFSFGRDITLLPGQSLAIFYDWVSARWRAPSPGDMMSTNNLSELVSKPTAQINLGVREVLTAARTYYVGANIPTPSISIASPAVVTSTAHGLSANDPVVFNVPLNTTAATISAANPTVVTMANTFVAGQPVKFSSTGSLPYGIVPGTTYYVISAGLSGSQFQISATVGGAAISTAAPTAGFTNGSANITITNANTYYSVGQTIRFANSGGALPTNFAPATGYYIVSASSTLITVAATNGGSAIVAGSAGTGTQTALQAGTHYTSTTGALPTGITEGTVYYVIAAGLTLNAFEVATTVGGSAVNTSGSVTGTPIYGAYTGNDANNGQAQTRAGAFLTLQRAVTATVQIDLNGFAATIQGPAKGTFTSGLTFTIAPVGGNVTLDLGGALIAGTSNVVVNSAPFNLTVQNGKITTSSGNGLLANVPGAKITTGAGLEFGACAARPIRATGLGYILTPGAITISGGALAVVSADAGGEWAYVGGNPLTLVGNPAFSVGFADATVGGIIYGSSIPFVGSSTGPRFNMSGGTIYTGGSGASYFPGNSAGVGTNGTNGWYI